MATETQTTIADCPTHGEVHATRRIPAAGFPFIITAIQRTYAKRQPYRCPACGAKVQ